MNLPNIFEKPEVAALISLTLIEDLGPTKIDITSDALVPPEEKIEAHCFLSLSVYRRKRFVTGCNNVGTVHP